MSRPFHGGRGPRSVASRAESLSRSVDRDVKSGSSGVGKHVRAGSRMSGRVQVATRDEIGTPGWYGAPQSGMMNRRRGERSMSKVELQDVRKSFGSVEVIHGVDVTIEDGEFVVLVGPSGCGKSTLLRMIGGLERITSGRILLGGNVVNHLPPKERDCAMVFQNYALYPHMTVFDNMGFSLLLRRADKQEIARRVREAAEILGLTDYLKRYPRQLSGGQRQTGRHGPRDRALSPGVPLRRAALQPRRQDARADAHRDPRVAPAPHRDLHLRHPRPGGSDDHGRPHRRPERGHRRAGRGPSGGLRPAPATSSSRASSARPR